MGEKGSDSHQIAQRRVEAAVRTLAARQSGNVTRQQLLSLGLSYDAIKARLRNGSFVTRYTGVYAIAPARMDPQGLIAAAVLAGGPAAVASHTSAAWLWRFLTQFERPLEISLPTGDRRPRHIKTHRCPSLQRRDITRHYGIPTTTPARTVLDIAPRLPVKQLTRLVNDALRAKRLRPAALIDIVERNPRHPGTRLLTPFLETAASPTDSPFEDDFRDFVAKYGLPTPRYSFALNGRRLDVFFAEYGVIVELDGWDFHKQQQAFEDDRERDADHLDHGYVTIRITKERFERQPDYEAARLTRILRRAGWQPD